MKKNKSKYVPLLCVLLAIPLFTAGAFALNHTDLKGLFTDTKDTTINAGDGEAKKQYEAALKRERMKNSTTAQIAGTKYTWTNVSLDKENKDSVANEAFEVIEVNGEKVTKIEATAEAVEAVASEDDLTIVVAENNGTATETVAAAQEESRKDDTIIVAVSKETVKEAVEESQQAETAVSENTVAPVENSPVETTNEVVDTAKSNSSTIVVEDCTEISYDDCTGFEF